MLMDAFSSVLKIPTLGGLIPTLGLGLGRGWGLELERFRLLKESLAPFVGSLKPTRLAFNKPEAARDFLRCTVIVRDYVHRAW